MPGIGNHRVSQLRKEYEMVEKVLAHYPTVDKTLAIEKDEFVARRKKVAKALQDKGLTVGFVFSDEHYDGDVPYLGGNTNVHVEQVAGVVGPNSFHIVAGLEGGYVAEQLAPRAGAKVHKAELLQLADEKYPIDAEKLEDILTEANGGTMPKQVALLTPRQVIPAGLVEYLNNLVGAKNVVDAQEIYYRIKYLKSDREMELIRDANLVADAMLRAMLAVLKPGMLETQVAAWGYFVGRELGAEEFGWDIILGTGDANRTLIGKALNREIKYGDYVHLGAAPKRDGLNSCVRRSVIAVDSPADVTDEQRYWFKMVEEAYDVGLKKYIEVAEKGLPAKIQEQALVDFFKDRSDEVSKRIGKKIQLEKLKPYTGTHNAGYTECQEFFGAITLESEEPLGGQIVTMLDVALRGVGNMWDDVVIPGFDYLVVESTLGKYGKRVEVLNRLPVNVQHMVGNVDELK